MPRYKKYDYSQSLLLPVNFHEQILPGTLEYTIHYVVDNKIDMSRIEKRFHNEEIGAPTYDPRILLKIVLMAYSRGIVSSRRIERLCRADDLCNIQKSAIQWLNLTAIYFPSTSTLAL